jgi:hypothetical protein
MAMLHWTDGQINPAAPGKPSTQDSLLETHVLLGCAARCWENTQYVSKRKCAGDAACLCSEPDYQNVSSNRCPIARDGTLQRRIVMGINIH